MSNTIEEGRLSKSSKGIIATIVFCWAFVSWGYVISALWGWFVVPLGVVSIGVLHGIGLRVLVRAFTHAFRHSDLDDLTDDQWILAEGYYFLAPWIALAVGYVPHWFMMIGG